MENEGQYQDSKAKYDCLLFDLDDTLYPLSSGLSVEVTKNIQEYMLQKLGIEENKVAELCVSLYKTYGTTMAGLKAIGYNLDFDDFHSFVHGRLPYNLLKPDPVLRSLLVSLPIRKVIFTNADKAHAARALHRLGLEDCFEGIICFETLNTASGVDASDIKDGSEARVPSTSPSTDVFDFEEYMRQPNSDIVLPRTPVVCKPFQDSFEEVFKIADIDPQRTLFFDDSIRNLLTGKQLGLRTVLVGTSRRTTGVDYALESIHNIKEALPELWETNGEAEGVTYSRKVAIVINSLA
ncbi:Haloacid dehalogenase-like hydrolase (HAD) superfamily protein [Quillaja saponaria]|uniref:Haloacid dehalogenase-like hydrolase (HAD) superfamily protein n=1 Tax=Quillaja saponaria TaxID=32244 RepID=A0AAD7KXC7_QUISA|nr:Haloacid dehalogenase-like hydrolase (HAD) superfamily protein [Quillaja saponaria]